MTRDDVIPVDLKEKRKAAGLTQQGLADVFGVVRETIVRVENGGQGISFPIALQCAKMFGSLTLRQGDETFFLCPNGPNGPTDTDDTDTKKATIPNDIGLSLGDKAHRLSIEAAELQAKVQDLARHIPAILRGRPEGLGCLVELIKEADDLTEWGLAFRRMVMEQFPRQYEQAREIILRELDQEFGFEASEELAAAVVA